MTNPFIPGFQGRGIIMATIVAIGSTMTIVSDAIAVTLKVSIENLGPTNGHVFTPVWFAFHDGSFDLFNLDSPASSGLEYVAEDGMTGLDSTIPGFFDGLRHLNPSFDGTFPGISPDLTLASLFTKSSAAKNGGVHSLVFTDNPFGPGAPGIFLPGQTATKTITFNASPSNYRYFNYASHVFPSNDAFIGNDDPMEIFDTEGNFIGANFIVLGNQVLDAGTEVNDENPSNVGFTFDAIGKGIDENGTVKLHPGLKPSGSGGVLDYEFVPGNRFFANADFKAPGYQVARITIKQVPEPATTTGLLALAGLFLWRRRVRQSA